MSRFIRIPLADGRVLSARLWLRDGETPVPVILEFRPYRGFDLFRPLEDQYLPAWAEHGYAVLAIDIAGSGQSTGELAPGEVRRIGTLMFATLHGLATMANNKMIDPLDDQLISDAVNSILTGLAPSLVLRG